MLEQDSVPSPDTSEISEEYAANGRLQAEQTVALASLAPEMPVSHLEIDAKAISVDGLIKACPHFANMAVRNPELAKAKATEVVQHAREHEAMRESGMNDAEIKKQQWAAMRERHKQKMQTNEKQDIKSASIHPTTAEHMSETIMQQATVSEEQKTAGVVSERVKSSVAENIKTVVECEPEQRSHQVQPSPLRHNIETEGRLVREQQRHEAARVISLDEAIAVVEPLELQSGSGEVARQTFDYEKLEAKRELGLIEQQQITDQVQEYVEQAAPAVTNEMALEPERLVIGQETNEWMDKQSEAALTILESLPNNDQSKPGHWATEVIDDTPSIVAELPPVLDIEQIEPTQWADELDKEPLQLYEDFSEALQSLLELSSEQLIIEPEVKPTIANEGELASIDETQKIETLPDIAVAVSERLSELKIEDKETVAPILAEIVETVHVIEVLNTEEAEPEVIEIVQMELEELTIAFFEHLGIKYEVEDVEQFVATLLLRPEFLPPQQEVVGPIAVDLEHDGTHEAKYHFPQPASGLADAEDQTQNFLGKLILFYVVGSRSKSLMPVC